ncbi:MAG: NAD-dependent epimerase/dehydratase family protein [Nanoarchaeota archaeon]
MEKILVTGATGQIGSDLVPALKKSHGKENVISMAFHTPPTMELEPYVIADARDPEAMRQVVKKEGITTIYHLVGILSAAGEKNPAYAWDVNMNSLRHVLELAKEQSMRVFWPSSIAAFGPTTPKQNAPQHTIMEPTTIYGVSKVAGELMCQYYFHKHGVDARSLRYPGLLSFKGEPGGGTTDYAVAMFQAAVQKLPYECFVRKDTKLPMMYMDDAIRGTIELMQAPLSKLSIKTSYNFAALTFSAEELAKKISKHHPLKITYKPDFRQKIADSWPDSIDDRQARKDWAWKPQVDLPRLAKAMIQGFEAKQ